MPVYRVARVAAVPVPGATWEDAPWNQAETAEIDNFRPEGSSHRPRTRLRLVHDGRSLHGFFRVEDRYVRCIRTRYGDPVCRDSCVELFVRPKPDAGYFNFEFNCGGTLLASCIEDPRRVPGGFARFRPLEPEAVRCVTIAPSLPPRVDPEIQSPVEWTLVFSIPLALMEKYVGLIDAKSGAEWRGNFYKCGDETSHPHWAAWAPVKELNFHLPECFGTLVLG